MQRFEAHQRFEKRPTTPLTRSRKQKIRIPHEATSTKNVQLIVQSHFGVQLPMNDGLTGYG